MNTLNEKRTILIIDGYHLLHKGYYGTLKRKKLATNREGVPINAIYTFVAKINQLVKKNNYYSIIVTLDMDEGCWRRELYPEYKAKRKETPEDLVPQKQIIREFLTAANIPWYEMPRYEADDIIGTINRIALKLDYDVHILSNDKDIFQLVGERTTVITNSSKDDEHILIDHEKVVEKFGCHPSQVADIKALMGDPSDNIKGVRYLHYAQAIDLLNKYGNIDNIFEHIDEINKNISKRLNESKELILTNKKITTIQDRLPIGRVNLKPIRVNWYGLSKFLKKQKMWAYVADVEKMASESRNKNSKVNKIKNEHISKEK
ncbi:5'-3' exonuclease [Mesoplasma florum L1]|uniref:5'-3' exonuclease n=1 Tax=Mesoplasma florum (strain ATCC 33453 / NBRC 100688 / NCTC 11704 / L1) TaxID=265311 RepID=Q6F262_MESFL|nr:5'-3' exonuclease [Mesoplasma florum]AAT75411.1 5'-3' exonuclease [Mesoplasma florum L1]ATI73012.1 5'-3' exonuclease [Mesoplasma florum]AVN58666.1 5'-3' exonuclease [Mesoplasma florum]AVN61415.1 5'-3' exonuclease [Mesoplasma florum]AVN64801.1 5'-3' exonuclease [Mesoplasma florum]